MHNNTDKLLKHQQVLFHTSDLALLWGIHNRSTLHTTISRYLKRGVLYSIHKGYYSTISPEKIQREKLLAGALNRYCYLTTESVLVAEGIIMQQLEYVTYASSVSRNFFVVGHRGKVRKLADRHLFNSAGIRKIDGIFMADPERAAADLRYFNPKYYFDCPTLLDWTRVRQLQEKIGYV